MSCCSRGGMALTRTRDLPTDTCNVCGKAKMGSMSNSRHLCGKCYLKERAAERKKKGLK